MDDKVTVKIQVKVSDYLPQDMEKIYVVGNHEKLGNWNPVNAMALKNSKNNPVYRSFRKVPKGTQLEFKIIRTMSYDHVQLGAYCEEVENLKLTADEDMIYQAVVYNWKEE